MKRFNFYQDYVLAGEEGPCVFSIKRSKYGGLDLFKNGVRLVDVMDFTVQSDHPNPSITVRFQLEELEWDDDIFQSRLLPPELRKLFQDIEDPSGNLYSNGAEFFQDRAKVTGCAKQFTGFLGFRNRFRYWLRLWLRLRL